MKERESWWIIIFYQRNLSFLVSMSFIWQEKFDGGISFSKYTWKGRLGSFFFIQ